jgi:SAM-dependent methyltransferase
MRRGPPRLAGSVGVRMAKSKGDQYMDVISCPFCGAPEQEFATSENGYNLVRCTSCALLFVSPRPALQSIDEAARAGLHATERGRLKVVGRFEPKKVHFYRDRIESLFGQDALAGKDISWLDIGAGYGELVEAVGNIVLRPERVMGLEPCIPKQRSAVKRGLNVQSINLAELDTTFDVVSMINVFSHIPDPRNFLDSVARVVSPGGSLMLVTGNGADIPVGDLPRPLDLPDHLVFAGRRHLEVLLEDAGFRVHRVNEYPDFMPESRWLVAAKNFVKVLMGRQTRTMSRNGPFRSLFVRAIKAGQID